MFGKNFLAWVGMLVLGALGFNPRVRGTCLVRLLK